MSESIEVKQSKIYVIFASVCAVFISIFFIGLSIFSIYRIINSNDVKNNDYTGDIYLLCFSLIVILLMLSAVGYLLMIYNKQRDIYTLDKIIRKRGKKIIFELPYENIITIKECAFGLLAMELKSHIIEANGKKGTRNFFEHYSLVDINRIKAIIADNYNEIKFQ